MERPSFRLLALPMLLLHSGSAMASSGKEANNFYTCPGYRPALRYWQDIRLRSATALRKDPRRSGPW